MKNNLLTIYVEPSWTSHPALHALAEKGHTIKMLELPDADLILSPTAHYWDETMWDTKLLDAAIKAARRAKKDHHGTRR